MKRDNIRSRRVVVSGVKPTGDPYRIILARCANSLSLLKRKKLPFSFRLSLSLNTIQHPESASPPRLVMAYIAIGLVAKKKSSFSSNQTCPRTPSFCWIFDTITTMPYLMRAHAYKDAEAKNKELNVGTFNYPMLMAADIPALRCRYCAGGR